MKLDEWAADPDKQRQCTGPGRCDWNFTCSGEGHIFKNYPDPGMVAEGYDNCRWHWADNTKTGENCDVEKQCHPRCDPTGCKDDTPSDTACYGCIVHSHMDNTGRWVCDLGYGLLGNTNDDC